MLFAKSKKFRTGFTGWTGLKTRSEPGVIKSAV
jgi:hypothetical protein